ncbi:hypothetical protein UlMin_019213 [Ulmus minor]
MFRNKLVQKIKDKKNKNKIKGRVVLTKKTILGIHDVPSSIVDRTDEFMGRKISFQLISAVNIDPTNGVGGKLGKPAYLKRWITNVGGGVGDRELKVRFEWDEEVGVPGGFIIRNNQSNEFFLKTLTLEDVPGEGQIHFVCNSWVYPMEKCKYDRVYFRNKTYLPNETPAPLRKYREQELLKLRGNGTSELKEWDIVYDYAFYNDLGDPDNGEARQILGGSREFPYPRRGRTGRRPAEKDSKCESKIKLFSSSITYVPRDEQFGILKTSNFFSYGAMSFWTQVFDSNPGEFKTFQDVLQMYKGEPSTPLKLSELAKKSVPVKILKEVFLQTDGEWFLGFPMPHVIKETTTAWKTDKEFARQMLAGVNPLVIHRLQKFPPASKLDTLMWGDQTSTISEAHIKNNLDGLSVDEAIKNKKLFILDHHDTFMPYLRRINDTSGKTYASRTLLFLESDGTLKPLAIELSLPNPDGEAFGAVSEVYTPADEEGTVESTIWLMAKAYVAMNDSCYHQVVSHWLNTHAVIEPFVIATNRQLSVLHPIHKLLQPHFRDTMNINALSRNNLISAGGVIESTFVTGKYSMEISAVVYKNWVFTNQALPADLIKRGMAVEDPNCPHGVRLLIEDYPYAVDGLEIWSAIKSWVEEYCSFYYKSDNVVQVDFELQSWWRELREEGHGDKKDEPWWPKMQSIEELVQTCTTIIWIASALHAAVNFGQYIYGGYLPNRPTISRRLIPEKGTCEYSELQSNPEKAFLKTFTAEAKTLLGVALIEILSRHDPDEVYLGERDNRDQWTADADALEAFKRFGEKLAQIENNIMKRNDNKKLKNRAGPVQFPYTLLCPRSEEGITAKGIPNSVSI